LAALDGRGDEVAQLLADLGLVRREERDRQQRADHAAGALHFVGAPVERATGGDVPQRRIDHQQPGLAVQADAHARRARGADQLVRLVVPAVAQRVEQQAPDIQLGQPRTHRRPLQQRGDRLRLLRQHAGVEPGEQRVAQRRCRCAPGGERRQRRRRGDAIGQPGLMAVASGQAGIDAQHHGVPAGGCGAGRDPRCRRLGSGAQPGDQARGGVAQHLGVRRRARGEGLEVVGQRGRRLERAVLDGPVGALQRDREVGPQAQRPRAGALLRRVHRDGRCTERQDGLGAIVFGRGRRQRRPVNELGHGGREGLPEHRGAGRADVVAVPQRVRRDLQHGARLAQLARVSDRQAPAQRRVEWCGQRRGLEALGLHVGARAAGERAGQHQSRSGPGPAVRSGSACRGRHGAGHCRHRRCCRA
jgi:hypothetical protein